ncbi:hypothetical protein [Pseudotabrizicola sp. 4114]|uniref:hypothetical protein n=1 Tax=Pseudotabrizicola sp. 4114 TaxID=2817731 RepID=UPI00285D0485|nr:hypothetical protein [Pseudorhodobacter sp. 4114]
MIRFTLSALALLSFGFGLPALGQELSPHQPADTRHICTAQPIYAAPGGAEARVLTAGEVVTLRDLTFGPGGAAWFALEYATGKGLERAVGYLQIAAVSHFCPPSASLTADGRGQTYRAPPNTCHLVAGHADTLRVLNALAASLPAFGRSASAYRLQSGGYALVLGLLSTGVSERILRLSDQLPEGSSCASGADFSEALIPQGAGFVEAGRDGLQDAAALLAEARQARDPAGMKRACDLGLGAACTAFASLIYDAPDGPDRGPAVVTRYALLGCMAGDAEGCKLAINRQDNTTELARDQALAGGAADDRLTTELAKRLCDAQDGVGCLLLARNTAADRSPTLAEAASKFAANLTACQQGIGWICEALEEGFGAVTAARGTGPTMDERFALAGIEAGLCTQGPRDPNQRSCKSAYYLYRDFLTYGDPAARDPARVSQARAFLTSGCAAGDPAACATLSNLPDIWPAAERQAATARAIALCDAQESKDSLCESLGAAIDATLPEARPALRARYDALAQSCLSPEGASSQDCRQALSLYAALKAPDGLNTVEAMLKEACSPASTKGCASLAEMYGKTGYEAQGVTIPGRDDPEAYLAALRMGCRDARDMTEADNTCSLLADAVAARGDEEGALQVRAMACEAMIARGAEQDGWACYDAAKLALDQQVRLPEALRWAGFTCNGTDASVAPYGCKLAGHLLSDASARPADPALALAAYQRGCFHHRVDTTDGEACLIYGTMLIDAVRRGETVTHPLAFAHHEEGEDPLPPRVLAEASRAFDMGCMDTIAQACAANAQLLEDWSRGDLPSDPFTCQVRAVSGEVTSTKPCRGLIFYQASDEMQKLRSQIALNVYVWPDGDRSVTYVQDGIWRLNEIRTDDPVTQADDRCWHNPISTRSFCVAPRR